MPKICKHEGCRNPVFSGEYCRNHQYYRTKSSDKKSANPKRNKRPNAVSKRKAEQNKEYGHLRVIFLENRPICEARLDFICTGPATEVHHKQGRGKHLLDVDTWLAVCPSCHHWITEHSKEAIALGLSTSRLKE